MAAFEAGRRKVATSALPLLCKLFGISADELLGMSKTPSKRGPASTLQQQVEQAALLPRSKQKFIAEMLAALIKQQQAS